jgi:hypothetical protein
MVAARTNTPPVTHILTIGFPTFISRILTSRMWDAGPMAFDCRLRRRPGVASSRRVKHPHCPVPKLMSR